MTFFKIYISCIIINRGKNTFELVGTVLKRRNPREKAEEGEEEKLSINVKLREIEGETKHLLKKAFISRKLNFKITYVHFVQNQHDFHHKKTFFVNSLQHWISVKH